MPSLAILSKPRAIKKGKALDDSSELLLIPTGLPQEVFHR